MNTLIFLLGKQSKLIPLRVVRIGQQCPNRNTTQVAVSDYIQEQWWTSAFTLRRSPKDGGVPLFLHGLPPHPRCFQDDNNFPLLLLLERFHLLATPRRRTLPGAPFSFSVIDQDYEPCDGSDDGIYLLVSSGPGFRVGFRRVSWRCVCRRVLAVGSGAAEERQGRHQGAPQDDILPSYSGAIRRLKNIIYPDALSFTSSLLVVIYWKDMYDIIVGVCSK